MKIELNYNKQTVTIKEEGSIGEVYEELSRLFDEEEMEEWTIVSDMRIEFVGKDPNSVTIRPYEYPVWDHTITPYRGPIISDGTGLTFNQNTNKSFDSKGTMKTENGQ